MKAERYWNEKSSVVCVLALVVVAGAVCWHARPACALVVEGVSHGYGSSADLLLGQAPPLQIFSQPSIVNGAPAPYAQNVNLQDLNVSSEWNGYTMAEFLAADSDVNISSNVDGLLGVRSASADSTVQDVEVRVFSQIPPVVPVTFTTLFELNATSVSSSADASGDFGALTASSTVDIAGTDGPGNDQASIVVTTEFESETFLLDKSPAPGTSFTILPGIGPGLVEGLEGSITVIMNELSLSGDGITEQEVDVNALRVIFNSGLLGFPPNLDQQAFAGEFIVSRSLARLKAVTSVPITGAIPEPSTMLLCVTGIACLVARRRLRQG